MTRSRFSKFAAVALAVSTMAACTEEPVAEEILRPVRYAEVGRSGVTQARTLAGVVRSGVESRLSFRVGGPIEWLGVAVGDMVSQGQALARLDATDYELRVEEARAALAQAEASLRKAVADRERVRALYENSNASKSELDATRAAWESAQAQVDARTKQLEQARQQVGYTTLVAPAAGAIASVTAAVNENVGSGQEICLLISDTEAEVAVAVPEVMIGSIEVGQIVDASLDALPGETFRAEVSEVGVAVTGAATTFVVTARFLEFNQDVRAGMAADVTFEIGMGGTEQMVVPWVAVGEDRQGRFVFVLEGEVGGEGTAHRRSVEIGRPREDGIEILSGLEVGERIVTAGVRRLADGERVLVQAAASQRSGSTR